jgi:hypothetical protein
MKNIIIRVVAILTIVFALLVGASVYNAYGESKKVDQKIYAVSSIAEVGRDIHETREELVQAGFQVTDVNFKSISKSSLSCAVKVNQHDTLDGLEYAFGVNLRPWRNGIKYYVIIDSDTQGTIKSIE